MPVFPDYREFSVPADRNRNQIWIFRSTHTALNKKEINNFCGHF